MNEQTEESDEAESSRPARELPIVTGRLLLRPPVPKDARPFAEVANSMTIASQMSGLPHPYAEKNAESWIAACQANTDPGKVSLVITLNDDGTVIGATGIRPNDDGEPEINYFLAECYWGGGLATEAAQAVVDHAFTALVIERIVGCCRVGNRGSRRVLEKCGFQYAGSGMCDCAALNSAFASEEFVLERSVWESLKRWGAA